jgi:hypothetical protein
MGHKNPNQFFNDPGAINPQTGQLLNPPPAPPAPPPDPKLIAAQARAQIDAATAARKAQLAQQNAQNEAIHLQVKTQSEIALARVKADLDAKLSVLDAHLKAATEEGSAPRRNPRAPPLRSDEVHGIADNGPTRFLAGRTYDPSQGAPSKAQPAPAVASPYGSLSLNDAYLEYLRRLCAGQRQAAGN